jgi:hypothetical protein
MQSLSIEREDYIRRGELVPIEENSGENFVKTVKKLKMVKKFKKI